MSSIRFRLLNDVPDNITVEARFSVGIRTIGLAHGEHICKVYVVAGQFLPEVRDHIWRQNRLSAHDKAGQVPWAFGLLSAVQEESP